MTFADPIAEARRARTAEQRRRSRNALLLSFVILAVWIFYVLVGGHWGRVTDRWVAALTMVFGSVVAGATPQGGGAVAFPVFTKAIEVPTTVARSFSLCIQTVGMGAASVAIITSGRRVDWRSLRRIAPAAVVGFLAAAWLLGRPTEPFWPARIPGSYVKVSFTVVLAAMAMLVWLESRSHLQQQRTEIATQSRRATALTMPCGLLGGVASFLVGSGADVFTYLALVALLGLSARIGIPTSVVIMAIVSSVGFVLFGILDGQLAVSLDPQGAVSRVGSDSFASPLSASQYDLFGLWLAAVPVVGFGAPVGSWLASKISDQSLAKVVVGLSLLETASTVIFLDELRSNPVLASYALLCLVGALVAVALLFRHRHVVLGIPPVDVSRTMIPNEAKLRSRQPKRKESSR